MEYTVVLQRPNCLAEVEDIEFHHNVYTAVGVGANSPKDALRLAQMEAYEAATTSWGAKAMHNWEIAPGDYQLIVMFDGAHNPRWIGSVTLPRTTA